MTIVQHYAYATTNTFEDTDLQEQQKCPFRDGFINKIATSILTKEELSEYCLKVEQYQIKAHDIRYKPFCDTPLHIACSSSEFLNNAKKLLSSIFGKSMLGTKNRDGHTPLETAFHYKNRECVKLLIEMKADNYSSDESKYHFIEVSCTQNWDDILHLLLKRYSIPLTSKASKLLLNALKAGSINSAEVLINYGVDYSGEYGSEMFRISCINGWMDLANKIISKVSSNISDNDSILFDTLNAGHRNCAKLLIENNMGIHHRSSDGSTPLHIACRNNYSYIALILINARIDLNIFANNGCTPFMEAVVRCHKEISEIMINAGADVTISDIYGWSPIHYAVKNDWYDIVVLLAQKVDLNTLTNSNDTPLTVACSNDRVVIANFLINMKVDVTKVNNMGWTALHYAAVKGWKEIILGVLSKSECIDVATRDKIQYTPLALAIQSGHEECAKILINKGSDLSVVFSNRWNILHIIAQSGMIRLAKYILEKKAAKDLINKKDYNGISPLLMAAQSCNDKLTKLLIKNGGNIHETDKNGWSVAHFAAKHGLIEVLNLINVNSICPLTSDKSTPLHIALENDQINTALMLINGSYNLDTINRDGNTPLHIACIRNLTSMAGVLLNKNCKINPQNNSNSTPLHIAIMNKNFICATMLINQNARLDIVDSDGRTALHIACQYGLILIVRELIKRNVKLNVKDNVGLTPLMTATIFGNVEIVKILMDSNVDTSIQANSVDAPVNQV